MKIELKVGDAAPQFECIDQNEKTVSLKELLNDKKRIILYFYPKDSTPGCTAEACSLRDGYAELLKMGFVVVGVSPDKASSHIKFIEKQSLPYTLLADTDHAVAEAYGVWGLKKFMGREYMGILRTTFVIDTEGRIERIFDKVNTKDHFNQIVDTYK